MSCRPLTFLFFFLSALMATLMVVAFFHGFPIEALEGTPFRLKSTRKLYEFSLLLFGLGVIFYPRRIEFLELLKEKFENFASLPYAIWILTTFYFLCFLWLQITRYFSLEINFVPFLFYDYMLWFFNQGKFCYTGFLHGYYHVNLILLLLYPFWKVFQTSWLLHTAQPLIAVLAAVPLYCWAKERLQSSLLGLLSAFIYLNFRYLQNVLSVNFAVEIFYPLFIFSAVYFAFKKREIFYYLSILLGLLIKEDSAIYFGGLGLFFLFTSHHRARGLFTILLSLAYLFFVLKIFLPWSGSTILNGDLGNYKSHGSDLKEIGKNILLKPWLFVERLFVPIEKTRTLYKLISKLLFLPLFSPWIFLMIIAVYPLFFRAVPGDQFVELALFYAAAVLPFLFLAFVDGWRWLRQRKFYFHVPFLKWGIVVLLIFVNGFNLQPFHFTREDLKTISLAKGLPRESIVVTQGHLLPYLGYRQWNFYLADHYGKNPATEKAYAHPDYYLFDFEANPYPLSREELQKRADLLKSHSKFKIVYEDERRLLLHRKK